MVAGELTGDELRRRHRFGRTGYGETERKREEEGVREDRVLTLSTKESSAEVEELERRRNRGGGAANGGEKDETDASM